MIIRNKTVFPLKGNGPRLITDHAESMLQPALVRQLMIKHEKAFVRSLSEKGIPHIDIQRGRLPSTRHLVAEDLFADCIFQWGRGS
jgi:hypothetical protein